MPRKPFLLFLFLVLSICQSTYGQGVLDSDYTFNWLRSQEGFVLIDNEGDLQAPLITDTFFSDSEDKYIIDIISTSTFKEVEKEYFPSLYISNLRPKITQESTGDKLTLKIYPYYLNKNGQIVLLSDLKIRLRRVYDIGQSDKKVSLRGNKEASVLQVGDFYKIGIKETGPVKISKDFFDTHGIDLKNIDPRNIQVWGHDSGMLPLKNSEKRIDDLEEIAIYQYGLDDGAFNSGDFIMFYGIGPKRENIEDGIWEIRQNPFSFYNYYFIKLGSSKAKTITESKNNQIEDGMVLEKINIPLSHEVDQVNLLERQLGNSGSGLDWYGESLNGQKSLDFSYLFEPYRLIKGEKIYFRTAFAGRHSSYTNFKVSCNSTIERKNIYYVKLNDNGDPFAYTALIEGEAIAKAKNTYEISYEAPSTAQGWLDYINITVPAQLSVPVKPYRFSLPYDDIPESDVNLRTVDIKLEEDFYHLWDISNPLEAARILPTMKERKVNYALRSVKDNNRFLIFNVNEVKTKVEYFGKVKPQNLHGISSPDMLIIAPREFMDASEELAEFRRMHNNYAVEVVDVEEIYNEFSSGRMSPIAIRDFIKMLYDRKASPLKHILLMGDATFDYRHILTKYPDHNFVPTMFTSASTNYLTSFSYDDFFVLMDDDEGHNLYGDLDLSIGRIPAKTPEEVSDVTTKIIHYEASPEALGDWRLRSIFVGDDDGGGFMKASDRMANEFQNAIPPFNLIKIHLDAFIQESFANGDRYPEANKTLNNSIHTGALITNYVGHGGPGGWTQERVLTMRDINQWSNYDNLPLFITATCTFSAFDNPGFTSGGELILLKKNGGGIGLFSTTRTVYDSYNQVLVNAVFDLIYRTVDGGTRQLGEMLRLAKNSVPRGVTENSRKFVLLGDPALKLAVPQFQIQTTKINSIPLKEFSDTLSAMENVVVEGEIVGENGERLHGFNGILIPLLYDKPVYRKTLGQESKSQIFEFKQQENVLFKGRVSVQEGKFKFDFILPKDIDYHVGYGKFSFYAYSTENLVDAMGLADSILIGGISDELIVDDTPPEIEIYLNDTTFINGDYTNSSPILLAYLRDKETGINVAGQSIGHDIVAYLDNDLSTSIILNNFYTAELDNPKAGSLSYLLSDIAPGEHNLTMEAWDLSNNKGEASINFIVTEENEIRVMDVKAVPNPFNNRSSILVKHNLAGKNLRVSVPIYDAAGRHVTTIVKDYENAPATLRDIIIDSESFSTLLSNMYFYSVILEHRQFTGETIRLTSDNNKLIFVK